jgi:hypothetical protein
MGALFSRLQIFYRVYHWVRGGSAPGRDGESTAPERLPVDDVERSHDDSEDKATANGTKPRRRALIVGISYKHSPRNDSTNKWDVLEGPFTDVELFRELLIGAYS